MSSLYAFSLCVNLVFCVRSVFKTGSHRKVSRQAEIKDICTYKYTYTYIYIMRIKSEFDQYAFQGSVPYFSFSLYFQTIASFRKILYQSTLS